MVFVGVVDPHRQQRTAAPRAHTQREAGLVELEVGDGAGKDVARLLPEEAVFLTVLDRAGRLKAQVLLVSAGKARGSIDSGAIELRQLRADLPVFCSGPDCNTVFAVSGQWSFAC